MSNTEQSQQLSIGITPVVNVAVAVIHYQDQYLLGFRNTSQHQGDRYEFVGGKIETYETASLALIREVDEETGISIKDNTLIKLGRLHHDYGDKQVCLHVYKVALTTTQYTQYQHLDYGLEGQGLMWVPKNQLLAGDYELPAANKTILAWLQLPSLITITYPLTHFNEHADISEAWTTYHQQHIPKNSWIYIRPKAVDLEDQVLLKTHASPAKNITDTDLVAQLMRLRPDMYSVLTYACDTVTGHYSSQTAALHLTHKQVLQWSDYSKHNDDSSPFTPSKSSLPDSVSSALLASNLLSSSLPLIISCHDKASIYAANKLAMMRVQHQLSAVIGVFLSPILATQSHPDIEPLGWEQWASLAQLADMPVIGLGGISPMMVEQASQYGAVSIAGIRQFLQQ